MSVRADLPLPMLRLIQDRGYTGCVGFEYFPESDFDASLAAIHKLWEANIVVRC
jgi:hydroxypyruvate isomerase